MDRRPAEDGQSVAWQVAAPTTTVTVAPAADRLACKYTSASPELSVVQVADAPAPDTVAVVSGWFEDTDTS